MPIFFIQFSKSHFKITCCSRTSIMCSAQKWILPWQGPYRGYHYFLGICYLHRFGSSEMHVFVYLFFIATFCFVHSIIHLYSCLHFHQDCIHFHFEYPTFIPIPAFIFSLAFNFVPVFICIIAFISILRSFSCLIFIYEFISFTLNHITSLVSGFLN